MKRLKSVENEEVQLEVGECDCGYHFGVDATFLEQVTDFIFIFQDEKPVEGDECPACHNGTIERAEGEFRCRGECGRIWKEE
jgi:hypothetical protein